jgi:hypothetical protein
MRGWTPLLGIVAMLAPVETADSQAADSVGSLRLQHHNCSQGVVFVPVNTDTLTRLLPPGLRPMDAAPFHPSFAGHAAIAVVQNDCHVRGAPQQSYSFAFIATPLDSVTIEGRALGPVRFDWFEFARFVEGQGAAPLRRLGFTPTLATLAKSMASADSAPSAVFIAMKGRDTLYRFQVVSSTSIDFPAQAHRFWHYVNGQFGYSQMMFPLHHSWIGQGSACHFYLPHPLNKILSASPCGNKFAVSELILDVSFEEALIPLGVAAPKPKSSGQSR